MDNAQKVNNCIDPGFGGEGFSSTVINHLFIHSFMVPYTASDLEGFFVMIRATNNEHRFGSSNKDLWRARVNISGTSGSMIFLTEQLLAYREVPCSM
jgi:hypothetical protein